MFVSRDQKDNKYRLEVTGLQLQVILRALDLFSRVGGGQFTEVLLDELKVELFKDGGTKESHLRRDTAERFLLLAKEQVWPELGPSNASWGIFNDKMVPAACRTAYDILRVFRRHLALERDPTPEYRTVDYDEVTLVAPETGPLPTVETVPK